MLNRAAQSVTHGLSQPRLLAGSGSGDASMQSSTPHHTRTLVAAQAAQVLAEQRGQHVQAAVHQVDGGAAAGSLRVQHAALQHKAGQAGGGEQARRQAGTQAGKPHQPPTPSRYKTASSTSKPHWSCKHHIAATPGTAHKHRIRLPVAQNS